MNKRIDEIKQEMEKKIQKKNEEKNIEDKIAKEKINQRMEEEIQRRLNEEINKKIDNEVQRKLSEELKKLEYNINNSKAIKRVKYKISMDIPEEIKSDSIDMNIEKLRKMNVDSTKKNETKENKGGSCIENCIII